MQATETIEPEQLQWPVDFEARLVWLELADFELELGNCLSNSVDGNSNHMHFGEKDMICLPYQKPVGPFLRLLVWLPSEQCIKAPV